MCASEKQTCPEPSRRIKANRQNAQKSTGPKTPEGKAISSRNAVTHGLYATAIVINSPNLKEDQSLYDQMVASLIEELKPVGVLQHHLVLKIANCMWRYRRSINAESATIAKQVNPPEDTFEPNSEVGKFFRQLESANKDENWITARTIPVGNKNVDILRYKARLDRELYRTCRLLNTFQKLTAPNPKKSPKKSTSSQKKMLK